MNRSAHKGDAGLFKLVLPGSGEVVHQKCQALKDLQSLRRKAEGRVQPEGGRKGEGSSCWHGCYLPVGF